MFVWIGWACFPCTGYIPVQEDGRGSGSWMVDGDVKMDRILCENNADDLKDKDV